MQDMIAAGPRAETAAILDRMLVLVVDDDPGISESLGRALRREGYTIANAADGEAALTSVAEVIGQIIAHWAQRQTWDVGIAATRRAAFADIFTATPRLGLRGAQAALQQAELTRRLDERIGEG